MKLPGGGKLRLDISEAGPDDMKLLGELLAAFTAISSSDEDTDVSIVIKNPDDNDALIQHLKGKK